MCIKRRQKRLTFWAYYRSYVRVALASRGAGFSKNDWTELARV
jgi:hypothetical protein